MKKRLFLSLLLIATFGVASAQMITKKDAESRAKVEGLDGTDGAATLAKKYNLNENGEVTFSDVMEFPEQTKSQLYQKIHEWIISMASDASSAMQVADKDAGRIVTRIGFPYIAKRTMGDNSYKVGIRPLLKFDFKDGKVRFSFVLQCYNVMKKNDDSGYGVVIGGGFFVTGSGVTKDDQVWPLTECYPFAKGSGKHPKVTSSRALVNSYACYKILADRVKDVLNKPLIQNNDNW